MNVYHKRHAAQPGRCLTFRKPWVKILHVYKDFDPPVHGGIERHIALMCRFQRQWADVEALVCSRCWRTRVTDLEGVRVTGAGEWFRLQSVPFSPRFPAHLSQSGADVVVVHAPNPAAELSWLWARPRAALVVRYHSDVVRQAWAMPFYGPVQQAFLRRAQWILPTSDAYLDNSATLAPLRAKCRVVPLGILPEEFATPDPARVAEACARYGSPFVFFCGRHRYYKGLRHLVEAARSVEAPVVIAGDGPERAECMALAERLGVPVVFPGALSHEDLVAHLHACAVFAFPSVARSEAFGIAIMEAHTCGKPVVATRLGTGVEYINEDGRTGLNVTPGDAGMLARALNTLLRDETRRLEMGAYAKARIARDFHAEAVARREFELFREAAGC